MCITNIPKPKIYIGKVAIHSTHNTPIIKRPINLFFTYQDVPSLSKTSMFIYLFPKTRVFDFPKIFIDKDPNPFCIPF